MSDTDGHYAWALTLLPAFSNPVTALIAIVAIVVISALVYTAVEHAIRDYNLNRVQYANNSNENVKTPTTDSKNPTKPKGKSRNKPNEGGTAGSSELHKGKNIRD